MLTVAPNRQLLQQSLFHPMPLKWQELLKQLLEEVYKINHNLIIYKLFYGDDMKNYIELCKAENVKGAIFFGLMNNDPQIE